MTSHGPALVRVSWAGSQVDHGGVDSLAGPVEGAPGETRARRLAHHVARLLRPLGLKVLEEPASALVVQGQGKYLMPGLADMHVHVKEKNELLLFVANGVTTVREMWGTTGFQLRLGFPDQLALCEQVAQGQLLGPTIDAAGITTDLDDLARFFDIGSVADTGQGAPPIVDMGADEAQIHIYVPLLMR